MVVRRRHLALGTVGSARRPDRAGAGRHRGPLRAPAAAVPAVARVRPHARLVGPAGARGARRRAAAPRRPRFTQSSARLDGSSLPAAGAPPTRLGLAAARSPSRQDHRVVVAGHRHPGREPARRAARCARRRRSAAPARDSASPAASGSGKAPPKRQLMSVTGSPSGSSKHWIGRRTDQPQALGDRAGRARSGADRRWSCP